MKSFFKDSKSLFTIHLDGWTDNSKNGIIGVSATEGIERFELSILSRTIGAIGENSAIVSSVFESVSETIGLRKIVALCTDNASVMSKARSLFVEKYPHVLNFRCIPHLLSLLLCDIIKYNDLIKVLAYAVEIVTYFNKSTKAFAVLKSMDSNVVSFKKYLKVRWGSIIITFESLIRNKITTSSLITANKSKKAAEKLNIPSNVVKTVEDLAFWAKIEFYAKFLNPIKVAIKLCESQKLLVADTFFIFSFLGTSFLDLLSHLEEENEDENHSESLCFMKFVVFRFLHRWGELLQIEYGIIVLCYVLHPA
jgi:hypothetical protein